MPDEKHCQSCTCGKRAPLQGEYSQPATQSRPASPARASGSISWDEHIECYAGYSAKYGNSQSAETLAARGGFGWREFVDFTGHEPTTWVPR